MVGWDYNVGGSGIQYRVLSKIAQGGMAEVYLGEAIHSIGPARPVAIKRLLPHLVSEAEAVGMFADEMRLGMLLHHPNIVRVHHCGLSQGVPYAVMEYVDGVDLGSVIARSRRNGRSVPIGDAVAVAVQVCAGLSWAHEVRSGGEPLGVIHRDITPPNILLGNEGAVKICDFGLAKSSRTQRVLTEPGLIKGKFGYLSPEAASGHPVDARSDVFSLAIIVWEMLTTRRLFLGDNDYETVKLAQQAEVPGLSALNSAVDEVFEQVLMRALARDPDRRYPSARAFRESLLAYADFAELQSDLPALVAQAATSEPTSGIREAAGPERDGEEFSPQQQKQAAS